MILVLAFCEKDKAVALRLAEWIAELGGTKRHDCLLGYHSDTSPDGIAEILTPCFNHIGAFKIVEDSVAYPEIANMMWKSCVNMIADQFKEPWFWIEPDAVPLTPDWLDRIEDEYKACGKPFMLDKVVTPTRSHNSGIGVYPGLVRDFTRQLWALAGIPWDVFFAEEFTPLTHHTALIHDKFYRVWEDPNSGPPVFPDAESFKLIESGAVLFHRNKDGSLIQQIRNRMQGAAETEEVFELPVGDIFADRDALLARIAELEAALAKKNGLVNHPVNDRLLAPFKKGHANSVKKEKAFQKRTNQKIDSRTPEQIQAAKDRMAKARAGRKAVAA